jgi:hypothetical protein
MALAEPKQLELLLIPFLRPGGTSAGRDTPLFQPHKNVATWPLVMARKTMAKFDPLIDLHQ